MVGALNIVRRQPTHFYTRERDRDNLLSSGGLELGRHKVFRGRAHPGPTGIPCVLIILDLYINELYVFTPITLT